MGTPSVTRAPWLSRRTPILLLTAGGLAANPQAAAAQSASSLAGWTALMLSPVGALPPLARSADSARGTEIAVRSARWEIDSTDAVHSVYGVTVLHQRSSDGPAAALTVGYVHVACQFCKHYLMGGVDVESPTWSRSLIHMGARVAQLRLAVRGSLGGGFTAGDQWGSAESAAVGAMIDVALPAAWQSWVDVAALPGVGIGRLVSVDETAVGSHPIIGGAIRWTTAFGLSLRAGFEHVQGGQSQVGFGLGWGMR